MKLRRLLGVETILLLQLKETNLFVVRTYNVGDCKFNNIGHICMDFISKWLNSEHVEQPTLTRDEYDFLDVLNPDLYIARDRNGSLFLFIHEPTKMNEIEWNDDSFAEWRLLRTSRDVNSGIFGILKHYISFNFIKWEDEKPWKVSDLLELEVKN